MHQRVLSALVLEEIVDAVLLHQPADEVEVGLAVLHAVFELRIRAFVGQLRFEVGEAAILEHLLDDLGRLLVQEDPAVGRARQQPEPGPQHDAVGVVVVLHADPLRLDQDAVELALLAVGLDLERALLADRADRS